MHISRDVLNRAAAGGLLNEGQVQALWCFLAEQEQPSADDQPRFKGYEPTVLRISPLARLGARMTAGNIAFDDHPNEKRYSDRIETVTVDSVFDWLERAGMARPVQVVR